MENINELMTVSQMYKILEEEIKKGNSNKFLFVNEFYIKVRNGISYEGNRAVNFNGVHVQDAMEFEHETGIKILDDNY